MGLGFPRRPCVKLEVLITNFKFANKVLLIKGVAREIDSWYLELTLIVGETKLGKIPPFFGANEVI